MTVSLKKPYLLDLARNQFLVVLRRYDNGAAPWGVHIVTFDLAARGPWNGMVGSRAVGLFSTERLHQLVTANRLGYYVPGFNACYHEDGYQEIPGFDPLGDQLHKLLHEFIWSQVVPMEWHGQRKELSSRMVFLSSSPFACDDEWIYDSRASDFWPDYYTEAFVSGWDRNAAVRATEIVELPPMEAAS